jgi:UDP:flavonoid glycosyltransferase YjiC (YdhE family)
MARVLIYTCPGSGHVYPPIATAIALREREHDVVIRTASASVDALQRLGLAAAPIDPRIEAIALENWKARTSIGALVSACETFVKRARHEVPNMQAAIEAERPDLIWVDTNATGAAAVAEASGLPWAHYMPHPHPAPARGVPVFGPGFAPSTSQLARLRDNAMTAHGGMGTTQKALAEGVPVCAVPFMRDQFEVARRVEHCGGGTLLAPTRLRPDRLRSAVEQAIACRESAELVRDAFEHAGGAQTASSALEGLLRPERQTIEVSR